MIKVILVFLLVTPLSALPHERPSTARTIETYVSQLLREHAPGINERYAGTFSALPSGTQNHLQTSLPKHRFVLADFSYSNWPPDDGTVKMLLVLDSSSSHVVGYCWAPWYASHSASFANLLQAYRPSSRESAIAQVRALIEAIVATSDGLSFGDVSFENGEITGLLILGDRPWRMLHVAFDQGTGFGTIRLINPITGRSDQTVVFEPAEK